MKNPNIKTKIVHSESKAAWNIIGNQISGKFKIARIPYTVCNHEDLNTKNRKEALVHAEYINYCFNHSAKILTAMNEVEIKSV